MEKVIQCKSETSFMHIYSINQKYETQNKHSH